METADIRYREALGRLLARPWSRVLLLAAQASRPLSFEDPGTRRRRTSRALGTSPSSLTRRSCTRARSTSTGPLEGRVGPDHPYGEQGDLAHLSKIYAEQCLSIYARRRGFPLAILRLGIVYGPSPVEHDRPESVTVVDKFRRLAAAGEGLPVDDPAATIGVVHVEDAARILLDAPETAVENVAAETVTVGDIAALAQGDAPSGEARCTFASPFEYRHGLADYLAMIGLRPARVLEHTPRPERAGAPGEVPR